MLDKKAQIGETMTWVVATIVIIIILTISVFIVSSNSFKGMREFKESGTSDLLVTKSFMGYLLTDDVNGMIFEQLKDKKGYPLIGDEVFKKNDRAFELGKSIFPVLYEEEYSNYFFWLGIVGNDCVYNIEKKASSCIGVKNSDIFRFEVPVSCKNFFYDRIKLKEAFIELMLGDCPK